MDYHSGHRKDPGDTLTRQHSSVSSWSDVPEDPLRAAGGHGCDPRSTNFSPEKWLKSMNKLGRHGENTSAPRRSVSFQNMTAIGDRTTTNYQKTVGNVWLEVATLLRKLFGLQRVQKTVILHRLDGLIESGEMLVVLGPPGSGCTTFLKSITGEIHGFELDKSTHLNFNGISADQMRRTFRGEAIYTAEFDVHFPSLTVGDTLEFAAHARAPDAVRQTYGAKVWARYLTDVGTATFGISHAINTAVGNDFVRGVSGGERKRVSIAEAALSGAPIQAWDNSTRGLDSANAVDFCKTLRLCAKYIGILPMVSLYQAPQSAYDQFDKVLVLHEGRQIFFGPTNKAQAYFENLGFVCPDRQTTADFLSSMTSPQERVAKEGYRDRAPRTADDFATAWRTSDERRILLEQIEKYNHENPIDDAAYELFISQRRSQKSKHQPDGSPYTLTYLEQVNLCLWRGFKRLKMDPKVTYSQLFGNFALALILGSVFYNIGNTAESFFQRGATLFFAILMNAFGSALEILSLYSSRSIIDKQSRYAMYHPSAEALASILTDMPYKVANAIVFNLTLYFMANLNRQVANFFFFLFVNFTLTLVMSMLFRTVGSLSRTQAQALTPAAIIMLGLVIFTGFAIPEQYMPGWCSWIRYIDPIAYGFESLMINEFADSKYRCTEFVPSYGTLSDMTQVCSAVGAVPGQSFINGTNYLLTAYNYTTDHKWRNIGVLYVMMLGLMAIHLVAIEHIRERKSKGEVLKFQKGTVPYSIRDLPGNETEEGHAASRGHGSKERDMADIIQRQEAIFSWKNVCFDITNKTETRRILSNVDGWVKPGELTALMGVSGAGKTTLLDVLANRAHGTGISSGDMLIDGSFRDSSFQRKTGYAQQQDLHLETSTVREALAFSALLRQPNGTPRLEKLAYVEEVIKLLQMDEYADAVVGVPGEGLNIEQRKRLTIGVELAAKPELLLFLDEPTSGLDSQTSWAICDLLESLKKAGQAILCTIHQPSAMLFQRFDRLLLLAEGGKPIYFGDIGQNSVTLIDYFEKNGAPTCPPTANPAEWMLEVIGAAPGSKTTIDWAVTWQNSAEYRQVRDDIDNMNFERQATTKQDLANSDQSSYQPFAAPLTKQVREVTRRVFEQYWRTPTYIYSKIALCLFSSLFIGFVFFRAPRTQRGVQNQMFSVFVHLTIFNQLSQQIMPLFVIQRSLYEAREQKSRTYSWQAFILSTIIVELCWNALMAIILFFCYYYPVGLYRNAQITNELHLRGALYFLFMLQFMLFTSTFTILAIAGVESADEGGNIASLLFSLALIFCGILAPPRSLPGFWIFMYRASPLTYLAGGFLEAGLGNAPIECADNEYLTFDPPSGMVCREYLQEYLQDHQGYLRNPLATKNCAYCTFDNTNVFLERFGMSYDNVWRNFGILWIYIFFNIASALLIYWLARVPKAERLAKKKKT